MNAELLALLRAFCEAHEESGLSCPGLNPAYLQAKALLRNVEQS